MTSATIDTPPSPADPVAVRIDYGKMGPGRAWHKIARDLDRALHVASLSTYENLILQYIREHTWGVSAIEGGDAQPCPVSPTALAGITGFSRGHLSRARAALIADRMILEVTPGRFAINKDVEGWGGSRITPQGIRFVQLGDRAESGTKPAVPNRARKTCRIGHGARAESGTVAVPDRARGDAGAYRTARGIEIKKIEEDKSAEGAPAGSSIPQGNPPERPARPLAPPVDASGHPLVEWAAQFGDGVRFFVEGNLGNGVPEAWLRVLVERKVVGQAGMDERRLIGLLTKILSDWQKAGECEFLKARPAVRVFGGPPGSVPWSKRHIEVAGTICARLVAEEKARRERVEARRLETEAQRARA